MYYINFQPSLKLESEIVIAVPDVNPIMAAKFGEAVQAAFNGTNQVL